ncbi:hypothetical protein ACQ4PT_015138 [Festuca glaucescens]
MCTSPGWGAAPGWSPWGSPTARNFPQVAPRDSHALVVSTEIKEHAQLLSGQGACHAPAQLPLLHGRGRGAVVNVRCQGPLPDRLLVRTLTGAQDGAYRCVYQEEDEEAHRVTVQVGRTAGARVCPQDYALASDDASGELLAVKSAGTGAAETLRREGRLLARLRSPHIVLCLGSRAAAGGEYKLFLEFAPRGSLADEAARSGGSLAERAIQGYASDVARGLAYLHGHSLVHGDVKAKNAVVGADGRAKLVDFGCARTPDCERPIGSTPTFMAPEVFRGCSHV